MEKLTKLKKALSNELAPFGFYPIGWFELRSEDMPANIELGSYKSKLNSGSSGLLIGNHAKDDSHVMWEAFKQSSQYKDDLPDPLDRWTKQVITPLADKFGAQSIYPFGDVVWPFQQFAMRVGGIKSSPLGLQIHPEFGLWHGFRAALIFNDTLWTEPFDRLADQAHYFSVHPCDNCLDKPCLSNCPVDAFKREAGFDVVACRGYLHSGEAPLCMEKGCKARAACPIGQPYGRDQIRFHMNGFKK